MTERTHEILGNERAFDDLHNLHISGEAIAFVGAGASAGLYPLWNELISKLIAETISLGLATEPDKKFWLSLLNTQPQQVVRSIKTKLQGTYGQILRDIFGHKVGADGKSYTPIHSALLQISFRAYVTTNYDPGLINARATLRTDTRPTEFATWKDTDTINRWITGDIFREQLRPMLFAHGIYDRSDTVVLGSSEYREAYRSGPYRALFDKLWGQERLVFVGFGFSDPWLNFIVDEVITQTGARTAAEPRHVAIIGLLDDQPYSSEMRDWFRDQYNATALFYRIETRPDGTQDHSELLLLLERIAQIEGGTSKNSAKVGLAGSESDKTNRFGNPESERLLRAMLADHSGFVRDRLASFVGRAKEMDEIRQRITEKLPQGGYVTITGQAGQGKSSVIAKLVEEAGFENVAYHFIPFNPGPDHQISLLRNLMARLILKYKLSDIYVGSESRPVLRDFLSNVLTEITTVGGQEVIFIDGLDQLQEDSNGERDLSFLPVNLPPGIVCVLGTRPNDTLKPLELLKPHEEYRLPGLTRSDFDLILKSRKVTLRKNLADRFHAAMQANALYLDLVAKELAEAETIDSEDLIRRLAANPDNIFSLTMDRLKRQRWQWQEVIKPSLGVLLAARMPLGQIALRQVLGVDGQTLRDGLQKLGGLLTQDVKGRYHLFHLKLRDYLRQDPQFPDKVYIFDSDEEEVWHSRLADWCEGGRGGLASIWDDTDHDIPEQERRIYARDHYIVHLYFGKQWEKLWRVLDAGQYGKAKVQYDPSTRGYVNDLKFGCQTLTDPSLDVKEKAQQITRLWRYVLLHCSLSGKAKLYPEELFTLLVLKHRDKEALELVEFLSKAETKVIALCRIAQALGCTGQNREALTTLQRAADMAGDVRDKWEHAKVFQTLSLTFAELGEWDEAVKVAYKLGDSISRIQTLALVVEELAAAGEKDRCEALGQQIKHLTGWIGFPWDDEATWYAMMRILGGAEDWNRIVPDSWSSSKSKPSDKTIAMLAKALVGMGHHREVRSMVYMVDNAFYKAEILVAVIKKSMKTGDQSLGLDLIGELVELAQSDEGQAKRDLLISASLHYSSIGRRAQATTLLANSLPSVHVLDDTNERIEALIVLAEEIADLNGLATARPVLDEATLKARSIKTTEAKGLSLKAIADTYSRLGDDITAGKLYVQAGRAPLALTGSDNIQQLVTTLEMQGYWLQAIELSMTDKYLESLVKTRKWDEAMEAVRRVEGLRRRSAQTAVVARSVFRIGEHDLALKFLKESIRVASDISKEESRIQGYISIVPVAAELKSVKDVIELSNHVIEWIHLFPETRERVEVLQQIAISLGRVEHKGRGVTLINDLVQLLANSEDHIMRAFILRKLSRVMAEYDDLERLIPLIQEHWLQITVRDEVLRLLPPAAGIIHRDQGAITNFMQSFKWVDDFLEVN